MKECLVSTTLIRAFKVAPLAPSAKPPRTTTHGTYTAHRRLWGFRARSTTHGRSHLRRRSLRKSIIVLQHHTINVKSIWNTPNTSDKKNWQNPKWWCHEVQQKVQQNQETHRRKKGAI